MKKISLIAVAVVACVTGMLGAALQQDPIEPCCNIKSMIARTRMVTVTEKATGCTYEFQAKTAADLVGLSVGGAIRLDVKLLRAPLEPAGRTAGLAGKPVEPVSKPVRSSLSASSSAATREACGSNVGRNAKTKTLCRVMTGPNSWEYRPC